MILCSIFFEAIKCLYKYFYWIVLCVFATFLCDFPYTIIIWGGNAVNVSFIRWTHHTTKFNQEKGKNEIKTNCKKTTGATNLQIFIVIFVKQMNFQMEKVELPLLYVHMCYVMCVYNRSFRFAIKNELQSEFVWICTRCIWKNIYETEIQLNSVSKFQVNCWRQSRYNHHYTYVEKYTTCITRIWIFPLLFFQLNDFT